MRTPKIGDIVHYTQGLFTYPAIVQAVFSDEDIRVFVIESESTKIIDAEYSKEHVHKHWSWPEEEKLCLHSFVSDGNSIYCDRCSKIFRLEKPKECEHDWIYETAPCKLVRRRCDKCDAREDIDPYKLSKEQKEEIITKAESRQKNTKAEELIERVWEIMQTKDAEWRPYDYLTKVSNLIKEYKGVK